MTNTKTRGPSRTERLFWVTIAVKGVDGGLQVIGALLLIMVPPTVISGVSNTIITRDLIGDPNGTLALHLRTATSHFADGSTRAFAIGYLMLHGLIKLALVIALLRKALPAFPIAIVMLSAFVAYEIWRAAHTGSIALPAFAAIDIVIIILITREYLQLRRKRGEQSQPTCH